MSYIYSIATHYHIINERERGSWHKIKVMPRTLLIVRITTFLMVVAGFSSWLTPDHNHPFIDVTIRTCDGTRGDEDMFGVKSLLPKVDFYVPTLE